ncbi:MAG: FecR domain-containing protein [Rhodoferax sp.]|nr:FecR domain-containing protein [Rhodoferax sp.]
MPLLLLLCVGASGVWADGTVTHLSGEVSIQRGDGAPIPATVGSKVLEGDIMVTGANGYGRLEMTDGGELVLRPASQLKVETYRFIKDKPSEDSFVFRMLKGGLRTVTGLVGKRGNQDAYKLRTATATIGIRGTQFDLRTCQADCGALQDGTYLAVRFGAVYTGNELGLLSLAAGQVGFIPSGRPPVLLPRDPGIGFTPPAVIPKLDEKKKLQSAPAAEQAPAQAPAKAATSTAAAATNTSSASTGKASDGKPAEGGSKDAATSGSGTASSTSAVQSNVQGTTSQLPGILGGTQSEPAAMECVVE